MAKFYSTTLLVALAGPAASFAPVQHNRAAFRKTSLAVLPDYLELPSDIPSKAAEAWPPAPPAVTESLSAVTEAAPAVPSAPPPPPEVTEAVTSGLPSIPDVSSVGLDMDMLPIGLGVAALVAVAAFVLSSSGGSDASPAPAPAPASAPAPAPAPAPEPVAAGGVDLSIPYDAAARLAYEKAGSKGDYAAFKADYEKKAVEEVKAKQKK